MLHPKAWKMHYWEKRKKQIPLFLFHPAQRPIQEKGRSRRSHPKTYSRYELTKLRLTDFLKDEYRVSDLPIRQINKVFIENFYLYIIKNHDCSPNTAMKFIQRFRTVVNFAQGTGLITADPFANYKLKFEYIERGYLDKDEISRICNKDFASKRLEQVRDIFIFSCYTGLSYVDICELTSNDIRLAFDDNLWIIKKRHKTKVTSNIRLLDIPKAILNKYEGKLKTVSCYLLSAIKRWMIIWKKLPFYVVSTKISRSTLQNIVYFLCSWILNSYILFITK